MVNYNEMTTTKLREALEELAAERIKQYGQNGTPNGDEQAANNEFFYRKKEWDEYKTALKEREDLVVQMKEKPDGKNGGQGQIGSLAMLDDKIKRLTDQIKIDNKDAGVDFDKLFAQSEDIKLVKTELMNSKENSIPKSKSAEDYDKMTTAELKKLQDDFKPVSGRNGSSTFAGGSELSYRITEKEILDKLKEQQEVLIANRDNLSLALRAAAKGANTAEIAPKSRELSEINLQLEALERKMEPLIAQYDKDNKGKSDVATVVDNRDVVGEVGTLVAASGDLALLGLFKGSTAPKKDSAPKTKQLTDKEKEEREAFAGIQSMVGMPKDKQDGRPGGETTEAIKLAQRILRLKETGNVDKTTYAAIVDHVMKTGEHMSETVAKYKAEPKAALSSLSESEIKDIQTGIAMHTTHGENLGGVNGKVTSKLINAVKNVERDNGLVPDGLIDKKVLQALDITGGEAAAFFSPQESPDTTVASKGKITR